MLWTYEDIHRTQAEIRAYMAPSGRASTPDDGGQRGSSTGLWWRVESQSRVWFVSGHNHKGNGGTQQSSTGNGAHATPRRRASHPSEARSRFASHAGRAGRTLGARRPGIAFALDE